MSYKIMSLCWPLRMPPTPKAVLISLADHAGDDGQCWPSIDTMCERTCFGRDAVIEAVAWLEGSGALSANRENGRKTTYRVTPGAFDPTYSRPSRRTISRASTSRADPPLPVGQTDCHPSGIPTGSTEIAVGQTNRSGKTDNQSGKTVDQSGKTVKPVGQTDTNNQEPSLNNQRTTNARLDANARLLAGFDVFYAAYPRKVGRAAAFKAWCKLDPDEVLQAQILADVALRRRQPDWTKENRKFVPHPATYLNGRRWEDESGASSTVAAVVPVWCRSAGFSNVFEAANAGCWEHNAARFRDGQRQAEGVAA